MTREPEIRPCADRPAHEDICNCVIVYLERGAKRCGRRVEVVRHYRGDRPPASWALCAACDAHHARLKASYALPIVVVDVGSELNVTMEVAFHALVDVTDHPVAKHGTDENPHVWFARPDEGPTAARCPCGRVTGWFCSREGEALPAFLHAEHGTHWRVPCPDRECDLPAGHGGEHYARWTEGHGNIGERSW